MKKTLTRMLRPLARRLLGRMTGHSDWQDATTQPSPGAEAPVDAMARKRAGGPIRLLFVCHMPALWPMFESIYRAAAADAEFHAVVVALPYTHSTLPPGHYEDLGVFAFLEVRQVHVLQGYDHALRRWLDPASLAPDYVFFQTPYNLFPPTWSAERLAQFARVCYVPYATTLFRGEVDNIVHPDAFFRLAHRVFTENPTSHRSLLERFGHRDWFREDAFVLSGSPKLDYAITAGKAQGKAWKRGVRDDVRRVLWTPRWWTADGTCHFFDYRDLFVEYCKLHPGVDLLLRPHPLCFQNFLRTGELTASDLARMESIYERSPNMAIDRAGDYHDTFLSSDLLVSDISSMLVEYLVTGKPIVYTHRVDRFNELGRALADGFYWARNATELNRTLEMLLAGDDPLKARRRELAASLLHLTGEASGVRIARALKADFRR